MPVIKQKALSRGRVYQLTQQRGPSEVRTVARALDESASEHASRDHVAGQHTCASLETGYQNRCLGRAAQVRLVDVCPRHALATKIKIKNLRLISLKYNHDDFSDLKLL
jgi:hypothetical protein